MGFYVGRQVICVSCENGIGRCWKPVMATKGPILTVLKGSAGTQPEVFKGEPLTGGQEGSVRVAISK